MEASKVSGEKYRRIFFLAHIDTAVRLEIFSEISFPCRIGNNCSCIYLSGNYTDFTILLARFDMFFRRRNFFHCSVLECVGLALNPLKNIVTAPFVISLDFWYNISIYIYSPTLCKALYIKIVYNTLLLSTHNNTE